MSELFNTLMVCAVLVSLFPLIKSSKSFYDEWSEMENEHWRSRGAPPFAVFHFGMFLFVPMLCYFFATVARIPVKSINWFWQHQYNKAFKRDSCRVAFLVCG
ncbi:hypothetical protein P3684_24540 [Vibrio parahaemolyticus]|nr:hypothetical protein [Vibrio parahaemolyticus]MDF5300334.1 hypothetical protein [Vibrio parahaemolyticus]MDG2835119.1 hypothetical protein [Vibrio parahaemolyticus]